MYRSFWLVWFVLAFSGSAHAAELQWNVPLGCPDTKALKQETEQVLGEGLAKYPLTVIGTVTKKADQFSLSLRITLPAHAETREREVQAATCQELLEAAAVAIALAAADSGEQGPTPAAPVAQSSDFSEPPLRAAERVEHKSQLAISTAATASWGALPSIGLGAELQLAWLFRWLRVGLSATWFPPRSMQLADNIQASFGLFLGELLVCGQTGVARAQLFACASAGMGRVGARLDEPQSERTPSTAWRQLGIRVGASYPVLPPLELTASLALLAPLTRPRFYTGPAATLEVHEPSPVTAQVLLGLLFSL